MNVRLTLNVLTASVLMAACAQTQTRQELSIQPLQEVRHSYEQAKAQYELGRYFHGQLRYGRAIEAYRRALAMDPGMVDAMNAMGAAYAESGNFALAREQFEAALKLQPKSVYIYNNLGFVNYLAGDYPAAAQAYKQALRLDGRHEKARQNLVLVMERMGSAGQIARTEAHDSVAAAQPPADSPREQEATQSAWVKVSPAVYEMHSTVALAAQAVAKPSVERPRGAAATGVASREAEPVTSDATAAETQTTMTAPDPAMRAPVLEAVVASPTVAKPAPLAVAVSQRVAPAISVRGVEVSNGNGVRGMAARVARYFSGKGIRAARLTNQKPFVERRTRIEYRPGSEAEAARINLLLPKGAPQVASNNLRPGIRVRLVLGHDLTRNVVTWDNRSEPRLVTAGLAGMDMPGL